MRIFFAFLVAIVLIGCEEKNAYVPPPPAKVTVAKPVQKPFTEYLEVTGNTAALESVQLRARVKGFLEKVHFADGDYVKTGDLLFEIDPKEYQAAVAQAKAQVSESIAAQDRAEKDAKRARQLIKRGNISRQVLDARNAANLRAIAEVEAAKAALLAAQINLGYTKVYAPIEGRMSRRLVDPGNLVGDDTNTELATIVRDDPIYSYFTVNERDFLRVRSKRAAAARVSGENRVPDMDVFLALANETDFPHKGKLDYVDPELNQETGTIEGRAVFPNEDNWMLPGMFVRLRLPVKQREDALMVPDRAVGYDQNGPYLLLVTAENTVRRLPVQTGPKVGDMRVIEKGVNGGERVVIRGLLRAIPGRKVTPELQKPPAPTAQSVNSPPASQTAGAGAAQNTDASPQNN